jgi:hypothetical protein
MIEGRFDLTNVIYVNRLDDGQTIFGKAAEFSRYQHLDLVDFYFLAIHSSAAAPNMELL